MIWKTTLTLLFTVLFIGSSYGQFSGTQPDLRKTFTGNCTANSYTIQEVFLSDASGNPISSTLKSCTIGQTRQVYVSVKYKSNANSDNYSARIFADLIIDGVNYGSINYYKGFLPSATVTPKVFTITNFSYDWSCGEELQLTNFLVAWTTSEDKKKDLSSTYEAADYNKAQCQFPPNIFISAPLAVQFDYSVCTEGGVATVNYTSTTNGGRAPLSYEWDFDNNGTIDARTKDAQYSFSGASTSTNLTVIDSENTKNSFFATISKPTEVVARITGGTVLNCNTSNLQLDASTSSHSGDPTYKWNTGETTASINVTLAGKYTVTVTDINGCSDTESITVITSPDTVKPTITCPADVLNVPTDTGVCYTRNVILGTPIISDNCGETSELTVSNNAPTIFPLGDTIVTWTVKDAAGNTSTCTQKVQVVDNQLPAQPTLADVTVGQCEGTPTAPTTTDGCAGTITGTTTTSFPLTTQGNHVVTWTFDDENGNSVTANQNVYVTDDTAPVRPTLADVTVGQCEGTPTAPTTSDNCAVTITGTTTTSFPLTTQGNHVVTWTFDDGNGNSVTANQNVYVTDDTAPVRPTLADVTVGQCEGTPTAPTTSDNCAVTITGTTTTSFPLTTQGNHIVTWTFDDGNGNSVTADQNVYVTDDTAPVQPTLADVTVGQCEGTPTTPTTTDNCAGTIIGTTTTSFPLTTQGIHVITWTFDDGNGNSVTANQNVYVTDDTAPVQPTLADVTVGQCEGTPTAPTTTDGCAGTITGTTTTSFPLTTQGNHVVTWTFDDGNGNSVTANQNVYVIDDTAPVQPTLADVTVGQCEGTPNAPTTIDACAGTITGTTNTSFPLTTQGNHVITWTFEDGNGNSVTAVQNVYVTDDTAPVQPTLADVTVGQCKGTPNAPTTTDACAGTITGTTTTSFPLTTQGNHVITWTFDDGNGNSVTANQNVYVTDNTAPVQPTLADVTVGQCKGTPNAPTTTDACAGTITGTTTTSFPLTRQGKHVVTWTFNDGNGNSATADQNIYVSDTTAPVRVNIPDAVDQCSVSLTAPTTTDNCSGQITGTTTDPVFYDKQGEYDVNWTFDDGNGNTSVVSQHVIVDDTAAPSPVVIPDAIGECEVVLTAPVTTDGCSGEEIVGTTTAPLTYSKQGTYFVTWTFDDGNGNTSTSEQKVVVKDLTAPDAVTLTEARGECSVTVEAPTTTDNCSGMITGTTSDPLTYDKQGTYQITWTFDDGNDNITTAIQDVFVDDVTAPDAVTLTAARGECSVTVEAPTTSDNCSGMITGTTSDPLTYDKQGTYQITWTFDDGNDNITTAVQDVVVDDVTAPDAVTLTAAKGECSVTVEAPTTTDNCSGMITGTTTDPLTYDKQGTYQITWTFDDGNDNITTAVQDVVVDDVTAPDAVTLTAAKGECSVTVEAPTTTDNCSGMITGTTTDPLTYDKQGEYVVTWTFNDGNGNITTAVQAVVVEDETAPKVISIADAVDQCSVSLTAPTTTDNCSGQITGTTTDPVFYDKQGEYDVNWTFDDGNGNTTVVSQHVIVDDTAAPSPVVIPDAIGECEVVLTAPVTTDGCSGEEIVGTTTAPLTYSKQGTYFVTWTFDDGNGNTSTSEQKVVVKDLTAPDAVTLTEARGECSVTVEAPTTTDNCSGMITGTTSDPLTYDKQGTYQITWTFDDGNDNITTAIQDVVVDDLTAPDAVTLTEARGECSVTVEAPTTSDNCSGMITGTTSDPLTYDKQGTYQITWTFDDGNDNITTAIQDVVVDDLTAPDAVTLTEARGECSVTVEAPTTTDNCSGMITGTTSDPLTYDKQGTYQITWTFDDGNDNITTAIQDVVVDDLTAPDAVTLTEARGECSVTVEAPTTTDNCSGMITGTTSDPLTYDKQGTYQITWTFDDGNDNITTAVQDVVVEDETAPKVISIADAVDQCSVSLTAPTTTDNCSGQITGTTTDPVFYDKQGEYDVNWTFDDGNGNTSVVSQHVIVDDTAAPSPVVIPDAIGECEVVLTAPVTTDGCSGEEIVGTTTAPLTYSKQGTYFVTWTFDDGNGNTSTSEQKVVVKDLTAPDAVTLTEARGECSVTVEAPTTTDNCSGMITGTTSDPLTYDRQGEYVVTWTFNDGNGNITTVDQNVIVKDVTAPESITLADATGECSATVVAPTTQDNCSGTITATTNDPMTYNEQGEYVVTWTFNDGNGNITTVDQNVIVKDVTAPESITLADATGECSATVVAPTTQDNCSGTITATTNDPMAYNEQGEYVVTWTFNDGNGNITTVDQNVIVKDVTAPESITLADATGECSATVVAPTTQDNCSGTITATTNDPMTYNEQGEYVVTWTFNDGNGNITTVDQNVIVKDVTAPESITLADATGECSATVVAPTTQDNCSGTITATTNDPMTYNEQGEYVVTWTFNDGNGNITTVDQNVIVKDVTAPESITLADATGECSATVVAPTTQDNCSGTITATTNDPMTYNEQGEYVVTWTFNDGNGNITTVDQNVIVKDVTAPESITLADATGECSATVVAPTTQDNCSGTITATTNDPMTYNEQGEYVVTWTFNDGNGNITTVDQNVIVKDVTAPESITLADATGECSATVVAPTTQDNCSGTITATTNDPMTYNEQGEYVVTWTFNDGNGNITTVDQDVIVKDVTAPESITLADATGECSATVVAPTTQDNCSGTITATTNDPMTYNEQGEYVVTWTFNDGNGNITTVDQDVIVKDVTAPESITLADATGECSVTVAAPTTTDNCAGSITGTTSDPLTYERQGTYQVTWNFDDAYGNTTTATQKVVVQDVTAPVWTSDLPGDVTVSCGDVPSVADMTAEDNCSLTVDFSEETTTTSCPSNYVIKRTWVATDDNSNSISYTQTITVEDTTAPTVVGSYEEVINISCEEIPMAPELTFEDNCSAEVTSDFTETMEDMEDGSFVITRTWTVNDCAGNETVYVQTVNVDPSLPVIQTKTIDLCTGDSPYVLSKLLLGDYNTAGSWEDPANTGALENGIINPSMLAVGQYTFNYVLTSGECSSTTPVQVSINDNCIVLACELEDIKNSISKAVTPNGDQVNDTFEIKAGADCGFTYAVKIFNRWGNMVYKSNNYLPGSNPGNWDGTSKSSVTGSQLPSGTYFYIIEIKQSGLEPIQGYIYLGTK